MTPQFVIAGFSTILRRKVYREDVVAGGVWLTHKESATRYNGLTAARTRLKQLDDETVIRRRVEMVGLVGETQ